MKFVYYTIHVHDNGRKPCHMKRVMLISDGPNTDNDVYNKESDDDDENSIEDELFEDDFRAAGPFGGIIGDLYGGFFGEIFQNHKTKQNSH